MRRLTAATAAALAVALGACGSIDRTPALIVSDTGVVTTDAGTTFASAPIGPVVLESGVLGGRTCYWLRDSTNIRHGVIWPFGSIATGGGIQVHGLDQPIHPGMTFWSRGGLGTRDRVPELGSCDAAPVYWLGGQISLTNPVPSE